MENDNVILMRLCADGDDEDLRNHLRNGAGVNYSDSLGVGPLHIASSRGHRSVVEILLRAGAEVEAETSLGWTPLMCAVRNGHLQVVDILINHGADAFHKNKLGASVLSAAVASGCTPIINVILDKIPEIQCSTNSESICPFLTAALYSNLEVMKTLLQKCVQHRRVDFCDERGVSLLMIAAAKNDAALGNFLFQSGPSPNHTMPVSSSSKLEGTVGDMCPLASDLIEQYGWFLPQISVGKLTPPQCKGREMSESSSQLPEHGKEWTPVVCPVPVPPLSPYSASKYGFSYPPMALQNHSFTLGCSVDQRLLEGCDISNRFGEGLLYDELERVPQKQHFCHRPLEALGQVHLRKSYHYETGGERTSKCSVGPTCLEEPRVQRQLHRPSPASFSLTNLLQNLNLENYIGLFMHHEIEMDTFLTLSHQDLLEIGIASPKSCKKLLKVIRTFGGQEHS